jgi:hypothetical protein
MRQVLLVIALLLVVSSAVAQQKLGVGAFRSFNMLDTSLWKSAKRTGGFYPLGFSADGWFAYTQHTGGDTIESTGPSCPHPPCRDGVTVVSLVCSDPCHGDSPSKKGDMCWCPIDARVSDLARFKIKPLAHAQHGRFPATIDGDDLSVEVEYKEKLIASEFAAVDPQTKRVLPQKPAFPGTAVFLVSQRSGRKQIKVLDHNHNPIVDRSVKVVGWIKSPSADRIAVVLGYLLRGHGEPPSIEVEVAGAPLNWRRAP